MLDEKLQTMSSNIENVNSNVKAIQKEVESMAAKNSDLKDLLKSQMEKIEEMTKLMKSKPNLAPPAG